MPQAAAMIDDTPATKVDESFLLMLMTRAVATVYCDMVGRDGAMKELARSIGTAETGPDLPQDAGSDLIEVREIVSDWSKGELSSDNAIELVLRILSGSAVAEDPEHEAA